MMRGMVAMESTLSRVADPMPALRRRRLEVTQSARSGFPGVGCEHPRERDRFDAHGLHARFAQDAAQSCAVHFRWVQVFAAEMLQARYSLERGVLDDTQRE